MNAFKVLTKKEFLQMLRDNKVIWLPLVFILLGMTQPVVTYYLPSIVKALAGGQGIMVDPNLTALNGGEVLASTLASQFDQLGLMILVISMMGMIQADKADGMLSFILTRPVTASSYIAGKVTSHFLMAATSVAIGYVASTIYANYLFTDVPFSRMIPALFLYLVWVLFIVTFTAMISTIFHGQGVIALISIVFLIGCRITVGLSPILDIINSASLSKHAMTLLITGTISSNIVINLLVTLFWIVLILYVTNYWIANKKFKHV
ncbi:ABC transporter permease [Peribacillus muralis]|uniref:ABC transporter permease n=1 Tax=Peribacillus muralis TaxID=264697 RepID=UPI00071119C4|nr:ABC transporter permease subunit [Peribacillus muralis]